MCGRFALTLPPEALARMFAALPDNDLPPGPRHNICPTQPVAAVTSEDGKRRLRALRWGFLPAWYRSPDDGPLLINARAESIAGKPAFRDAAHARRCLVPVSGFYEWQKGADGARLPWFVRPAAEEAMALAGIWQNWEGDGERLATCAIVTTEANADVAPIHHRMPVIVAEPDWPLWLGEAGHGAARLMRPAPEGSLCAHRVATAVNSARAVGPGLMVPLGPARVDKSIAPDG